MPIWKKIWGKIGLIWFGWGFLFFMLIIFPLHYYFLKRERKNASHNLNKLWGRFIFMWGGIRVKLHYLHPINPKQVYVITPNHKSYLDIPACHFLPMPQIRFIGKAELNKVPLFGWMFQRLHIPVQRDQPSAAARSFILSQKVLQSGISMVIYPEGGIKSEFFLAPFKDGPFSLAIRLKIPILPVVIQNTKKIMPDNKSLYFFPFQTIHLHILDPISTENLLLEDVAILKEKVWNLMYQKMKSLSM